MTVAYLLLGLILLLLGGDWLVRGASAMARTWNVSPVLIGVTIVGMGTSAPELMVSLKAALSGSPGIAIGNVIGSNIANILLILGLAAAVTTLPAPFAKLRFDIGWMIGASVALALVLWDLTIGRLEALALLAALGIFLTLAIRRAEVHDEGAAASRAPLALSVIIAIAGLAAVLAGAWLLVDSASAIARQFGVSEAVIGLTIVAVGTSLPEMATSVIAAFKGQREIAIGNAVGSNVFNILGILGATALIKPVPVEPRFLVLDVWIMIATAVALAALLWLHGQLSRRTGLILLSLYVAYAFWSALG